MAGYAGSVTFHRLGRSKRVPLYRVVGLSALESFVQQIEPYTAGGISRCAVTDVATHLVQTPRESIYVGYYAVFQFRYPTPEEGENPLREFQLADPLEDLFELDADDKIVIKQPIGAQFAAWYSAAAGKTYNFEKGWLWQG